MELLLPHPSNSSPLTVLGYLERAASVYGDSPSLLHATTVRTWSETHSRCLRIASTLASSSLGINRGQVVSVIGPNVPSVYELQFAVPMSGAILNNINPRLDANALSVLLRHSETKLVFVDHHSSSLVLEAVSFLPKNEKPRLVLLQDDVDMTPLSSDVEFLDTYEGVMERGDKSFKWVRPSSEWNPMVLNYTSGTTSSPKGVVLSHRAVFMSTINSLLDWSMPNRPVYLWTLPMFHANGWSYTWATAAVGATNICLRRVDAKTIYESIDKHHVTHMCAAPMVLNMLTNYPARKQLKQPVREVETVLYTNPVVKEAAVVAKPDKMWGETPCAFVSLKCLDGSVSEREIREFCKTKLPKYMVPRNVVFQEELPKTSTGKIQKFVLRQMAKSLP
ncbi:hypothetical protein IGI04_029007 [Brassica rapa subsp. trilocularis]|uniref:AMP-dependent synthetase/ligase domain-containing protein n=1 Tax=Brassica rapa subsp. trilocularis TaxID=1813537 RepID=A0ABQ7L3K0_BRACM|nr:hypothetical protein IGI04_029007 [Brassica rapa subsp. trilocularis]